MHTLELRGWVSDDLIRVFPFVWFACEHPERSLDEACLFESDCAACDAEWLRRGCPVDPLPRLAEDAPIFREVPT